MAEISIEYVRDVVGHPTAGSTVTVEDTDAVQALISNGFAVEIDTPTSVPPSLTGDGTPRDGEIVAPDGSTVLPADGYEDMKVDELRDEIVRRNADRDDYSRIPHDGKKADLIAALRADDTTHPEPS